MNISIPHNLQQEDALSRIKGLLSKLKEEQSARITGLKENWQGNKGDFQFSIQGYNLSGQIAVNPSSVDIDADLPFALTLFQGAIKQTISGKISELLTG